MSAAAHADRVLIIYDGDCYFCRAYVGFLRLQQAVGPVELISARSDDARVRHFLQQGIDLDAGMLVVTDVDQYAGADAMHWLASQWAPQTATERLHAMLFKRRWLARLLYPLLRLGRRVWLALRRVPPIRDTAR
ncbi:MAG: DCC1-like thiol-disulfide oxidoreductase family protein [Oxalobacteraceae bacterium]